MTPTESQYSKLAFQIIIITAPLYTYNPSHIIHSLTMPHLELEQPQLQLQQNDSDLGLNTFSLKDGSRSNIHNPQPSSHNLKNNNANNKNLYQAVTLPTMSTLSSNSSSSIYSIAAEEHHNEADDDDDSNYGHQDVDIDDFQANIDSDKYFELNPNHHPSHSQSYSLVDGSRSRSNATATTVLHQNNGDHLDEMFSYSMSTSTIYGNRNGISKTNSFYPYPTKNQKGDDSSRTVCETFSSAEGAGLLDLNQVYSLKKPKTNTRRNRSDIIGSSDNELLHRIGHSNLTSLSWEEESESNFENFYDESAVAASVSHSLTLSHISQPIFERSLSQQDSTSSQVVLVGDVPYRAINKVDNDARKKKKDWGDQGKKQLSFWDRLSCGACMILP